MPAALTLEQLVASNAYRNTRHRGMLSTSPTLPWPQLAELQSAIARTDHELERAEIAREFQRRVRALADDPDEQEVLAAERREFDQIVSGDPVHIDFDRQMQLLNRWSLAMVVRDCRRGAARPRPLTWRETAEQTGLSIGRARRLLAWLERGPLGPFSAHRGVG